MEDSIERSGIIAQLADDCKASDIIIMDLRGICDFTDAFVICTGNSGVQIRAITKMIDSGMKEKKLGRAIMDGADGGVWAVMDYGDIVVHIMNQESREYYRLESLWGDAKRVEFEPASSMKKSAIPGD